MTKQEDTRVTTCKDCTTRYLGCQDHCKFKLERDKKRNELKEKIRAIKHIKNQCNDFHEEQYYKYLRCHGNRHAR